MTVVALTEQEEQILDYIDEQADGFVLVPDAPDNIVQLYEQYMKRFEESRDEMFDF